MFNRIHNKIVNFVKIVSMKSFIDDRKKDCQSRTVVSLVLAAVSFILMFADLRSGSVSMAVSSIILVAGFCLSALAAGILKKPLLSTIIIAIMAAAVLSIYAISGGNEGFAILWILIVPMFAISTLNLWVGVALSFYFLIFLNVLFYTPLSVYIADKYTSSFLSRFPVLYACVFVLSVFLSLQKIYYYKKANLFTYIDDLTGLYTRQYFFHRAKEVLEENPDIQYDLEISDILDFKKINELYGVSEADKILKWIAKFLSKNLDDNFIVGRYGSDQFVVMAPHDLMEKILAKNLFDDFLKALKDADVPNCELKFGIYESIPHDCSVVSSCDKAHIALNSIKKQYGKTISYFDDKVEKKIDIQRKIESSMRKALEEDQFKVFYQPKHDAKTGDLVGAEALVRWIHPIFGFMPPGEFIPLFEQNGFVIETDFFVWQKTCQNMRKWIDKGFKAIPISVNSSKLVFEQDDLLERALNIIHASDIPPELLHIEVTETMMNDDVNALINKLNLLRSEGFKVELDDFGSGYSSMNILSTLPLDIVKLDMSFMKQFGNEKGLKVLSACIGLSKDLGYKTVSEGVELKEQVDALSELGVDYIQGYYYSKPLPADEFEKYMEKYS